MLRRAEVTTVMCVVLLAAGCGGSDPAADDRDADADAGSWRTWVLPAPDAIRVPPPTGTARDAADGGAPGDQRPDEPAVRRWLEHVMSYVAARPKDPPIASRNYALVSVAMYDAAVAAYHWKRAHGDSSYPSEHAAIAGAASRVLAALYPAVPAAALEQEAAQVAGARVRAGKNDPGDVEAGLRLGRAVARHVIRYARRDRAGERSAVARPGGRPAHWSPPPGQAARPVQPAAGRWRTWVMSSGSQFRPPPPPAFGTPAFAEQVRAVVEAGERLTPEQRRAARFWEGGEGTALPPGIWMQVVLERLEDEPQSTPRTARIFALLTVAMADAGVAAWDAKYRYWYPRPEPAIRDSGLAPGWEPLLDTPLFPAYVSGHSTYSAAAGEVLSYLLPQDEDLWRRRAREAGLSRIWGGIHWPVDHVEGRSVGLRIGRLVVERARHDGADG